ncbi:arabinofuranosidase catalytic domain-containing protein [Kitasatospora sp. NBC_00315]|uniref:arabinofuranosidase catalytic domain-containing protein n=1 Tax=Kitasatospora sp. NBC_00315 TaxID=2975963 RepID=UPI0032515D49
MFQGNNGSNTANTGDKSAFVTAVLKNDGQTTYALKGGDSQSGGLTTWWNGALPTRPGYRPMHQEGGIILGTGGDNSNWNRGTFFEGVMVAGLPSGTTENAVQANIVSVGYSGETNVPNGPQGRITGPGGKCADVAGDDTAVNGAAVRLWDCQNYAEDQYWTQQSAGSLSTIGRCLDITGNETTNGTLVELWDCNGGANQVWKQQSNGSLLNPRSGRCLDSPNASTANGTRLEIWDCNGTSAQTFTLH